MNRLIESKPALSLATTFTMLLILILSIAAFIPIGARVRAASDETLTALFANGPNGATTANSYTGNVTIRVSGTGQAAGPQYSDAFYIFTDDAGNPITPVHPDDFHFSLCIDNQSVNIYVPQTPPYRSDHTYQFTISVGSTPQPITFGICDTFTSDNTGSFTISVIPATQISSDTYPGTAPVHATEVEPDTFSVGSTIVSAFQVGRFSDGGATNIGWATSTDGGKTWHHDFLPGITTFAGGSYDRVSDPSVAYDAKHGFWMIASLAITKTPFFGLVGSAVLVSRSKNGLDWDVPVVVHSASYTDNFDKEWIVCDNVSSRFIGHCYIEWDNVGVSVGGIPLHLGEILMSTSSLGGASGTWGASLRTHDKARGLGGQPLVQPDGTVIVPELGCRLRVLVDICTAGLYHIFAFTSTDGGKHWNDTHDIEALVRFHQPAALRVNPLPSAEVDASGKVYVVWSECNFESLTCPANDLVWSTSTNGIDWSPVQRVPIDPKGSLVDHFIPGLAVDSTTSGSSAHLALAYYYYPKADCTTDMCELDVGYISSIDGGNHWSSFTQIAGPMQLSWLAQTDQGAMVGDYISTSISGGVAYPVFAVAIVPVGGLLDEAIYTTGEEVIGGSIVP